MKRPVFAAVIVSLLAGCAQELVIPPNDLPNTVSDTDRKRCEEFARAQSDAIEGKPVAGLVFMGVLLTNPVTALGAIAGQPIFLLPFMEAFDNARENRKTRQHIYEEALKNCLEPSETPQQAAMPEYPNPAEALRTPEHNRE